MKTRLMEIIFRLEVNMDQVKMKKNCLGYFWRFATSSLTLRSKNTYLYIFQVLFGFCNFFCQFLWFLEARGKLILLCAIYSVNRVRLLASTCTSFLLQSNVAQQSQRHFFSRFQTKEQVLRAKKSKNAGENTFNEKHFGIEGNHGSSKGKKNFSRVLLQICDQCFN